MVEAANDSALGENATTEEAEENEESTPKPAESNISDKSSALTQIFF